MISSFSLLYSSDVSVSDPLPFKVIGHQWYWTYEVNGVEFSSRMLTEDELQRGELRLLTTDTVLILPAKEPLVFYITSDDVIHSWSVPALGIKVDAVPGRLNQVYTWIDSPGIFYGQCSEICGQGHGFMPIQILVVDAEDFWLHYGALVLTK